MTANTRTTALEWWVVKSTNERYVVKATNDFNTRTTALERLLLKTTMDSQHQNHLL